MQLLPSATTVLFNAITPGTGTSGTKLDIAYLEYVNGSAVTKPESNASNSTGYYDRLNETPDRDFLRCAVLSHQLRENLQGRPVLFLTISSDGTEGVHGKPFSASAGSRIYGVTLAASQASGNISDDILFATHYYEPAEQMEKPGNGGVMLSFNIDFE